MARLQGKGTPGWILVLLVIVLAIIVIGLVIAITNPALLPFGTPMS